MYYDFLLLSFVNPTLLADFFVELRICRSNSSRLLSKQYHDTPRDAVKVDTTPNYDSRTTFFKAQSLSLFNLGSPIVVKQVKSPKGLAI
jgi:hypothetical protein